MSINFYLLDEAEIKINLITINLFNKIIEF
jgi:hypothetical protein